MSGRHSAGRPVWQLVAAHHAVRPLRVTDARTYVEHLVTDEHQHEGRYRALCGARVLAASLTAGSIRRCSPCAGRLKVVSR